MPTRYLPLLALLLGFTMAACNSSKKDDAAPNTSRCTEYVAGDVAVGIKATADIDAVFAWINSTGLHISQVNGFTYVSGLPADSLAYVNRTLLAKPYLDARGFKAGNAYVLAADRKIRVGDVLFDMTPANQADWLRTRQTLQLADEGAARCQSCKDIFLKVPVGVEKYWAQELARHPATSWAELNCIGQIVLH